MEEKCKVIAVVGPTASGKSGLAIKIAKTFNGEVISADSRQVYRGLDIGTAKVTAVEMDGVPHHLIDVVDVDQTYNAIDFTRDAAFAIKEISGRAKLPVIAGGTFFYIDTLLGRITTPEVPPNEALRTELETKTTEELFTQLQAQDPRRAAAIDRDNPRRLIRALEIVETIGTVPPTITVDCPYNVLTIGLGADKKTLRARYRSRAETWLANGFQSEVAGLLTQGVSRARLQEIGFEYTLMVDLIDGELTQDEFVQKFIEKNWQYAKRQLTWLKRDDSVEWFALGDARRINQRVHDFLQL